MVMFMQSRGLRRISVLVTFCYLSLVTQPLQAAVQQDVFARPKPGTDHSTPMSQLEQMRELMRKLALDKSMNPQPQGLLDKARALMKDTPQIRQERDAGDKLLAMRNALIAETAALNKQFDADARHIADKHLPAVIRDRQQAVQQQLQARQQQLLSDLDQLARAQQQDNVDARHKALDVLSQELEQWGGEKAQYTDVKHLPWGMPSNKVRAPLDSKQAYLYHLHDVLGVKPLQVAGPLPTDAVVWPVLPRLPATAQAADTLATEDVQLTPAIQAKAAELNHNPAQIYKWVYDNIDFVPTYGSIQGADYTLQTGRGNAFDTASLLIALLRASNIPARYVYGTIEAPINQVMNWVGGVTNPDAAQNLLGQGGVPNLALVAGGKTVALRMEHVWVEAFVDFVPSRGVVNKAPDTWIPLDASYKQNTYTPGMDLSQAVPFDAQAVVTAAQTGATVDPSGAYVQNLNQAAVQSAVTDYQQRLQTYMTQQQPNATVGDVLGTKTIKSYAARGLSDALPYKVTAVGGEYQALPDNMRHYFHVQVFQNDLERQSGAPAFDVRISTPSLGGKPLALSFKPGSAADEQTLESYLPQKHADGSPIQPSELPTTFPGYVIHMTPELTLDGQTLQSGGDFMLGQEVTTLLGYEGPNASLPPLVTKIVRAGEYHAIGYDLQGMGQGQLIAIQAQLQGAKSKLESQDLAQIQTLTKHDLSGAMLQVGVQGYFAKNDAEDRVAASQENIVLHRYLSFGTFSTNIQPNLKFGFPLAANFAGMMMDIDRMWRVACGKDNNRDTLRKFMLIEGPRESANEHIMPELLYNHPNVMATQAVSAVKALQIADQEGQKIFTITKDNFESTLPQLKQKSAVLNDVRDAVNAGKVVTISYTNINFGGWKVTGYVIIDPENGSGAYLIDGAVDGAYVIGFAIGDLVVLSGTFLISVLEEGGGIAALGGVDAIATMAPAILELVLPVIAILTAYIYMIKDDKKAFNCFKQGIIDGAGLRGGLVGWSFEPTIQRILSAVAREALAGFGLALIPDAQEDCLKGSWTTPAPE